MFKIKFIIVLIILDILLSLYLKNLLQDIKPFIITFNNEPLIYQKKEIIIDNIDQFVFDDYFYIFNNKDNSYFYKFDDKQIQIHFNLINKTCTYPYTLKKPQIIEKTIYKTITEYVDNNEYVYEETCELLNDYFVYELGTDLSNIIMDIGNNAIYSTYKVTCDYSKLNPYQIGQYNVYFYTNDEKYTITVEIK